MIELDRDLIPGLRTQFFRYPELTIHEGDALRFDYTTIAGRGPLRGGGEPALQHRHAPDLSPARLP